VFEIVHCTAADAVFRGDPNKGKDVPVESQWTSICSVVHLMNLVMDHQSLLHRQQAAGSEDAPEAAQQASIPSSPEAASEAAVEGGHSSDIPIKVNAAVEVPMLQSWHVAEECAARVAVALRWLICTRSQPEAFRKDQHTEQFCKLLNRLLAGHITNLGLDMSLIFNIGFEHVVRVWSRDHGMPEHLNSLSLALLQRLIQDRTLQPPEHEVVATEHEVVETERQWRLGTRATENLWLRFGERLIFSADIKQYKCLWTQTVNHRQQRFSLLHHAVV